MVNVMKYNVATKEMATVPFPTTYAWEWAYKNNIDPELMFIIINKGFSKESDNAEEAQAHFDKIVNVGMYADVHHYSLFMAGSGHLRKAQCVLLRDDIRTQFSYWVRCGVNDTKNMVANKTLVYRAVSCLSASRRWEEMTRLPAIDIDKVGIFKDVEVDVEGIFDVVTSNKVTRERRVVTNKISDGYNILVVPDETKEEDMSSFTFRAPGFKGLLVPVKHNDLIIALDHLGLSGDVVDAFGVERYLPDLNLIGFCSTFKWSKCADWEKYVSNFKKLGHEFRICITDHDTVSDLPYQQFQTLVADEEDLQALTERTYALFAAYDDPKYASRLLPKFMGKAARLYPSLFADEYVNNTLQTTYKCKRWSVLGGRIPDVAKYRFAAPDPVAILLGMHKQPMRDTIPAKHVVCNCYPADKVLDVTRCPHLDNAHLLRKNFSVSKELSGLYTGKTMYFSCHDASMNSMQMDFDGDHVAVCDNPRIIKMALKSIKKQNNVPLFYEAKGTKPGDVTKEQITTMLSNLQSAPVGLFANTLTKIWATGRLDNEAKIAIAFLTEGGNTCIDAAKYITGDSGDMENPGAVWARNQFGKLKKPMFLAYAKSSAMVTGSFEKAAESCAYYKSSAVDSYSDTLAQYIPESIVLDGQDEFDFRYKTLCDLDAQLKLLPGLTGPDGLFHKLAFMADSEMDEARKVPGDENSMVLMEIEEDVRRRVREAVFQFGAQNGFSMADTVNALVLGLFRIKKYSPMVENLMRVLWAVFGEELYANVRKNVGKEIPENDPDDDEDIVDGFGMYRDEEQFCCYESPDFAE